MQYIKLWKHEYSINNKFYLIRTTDNNTIQVKAWVKQKVDKQNRTRMALHAYIVNRPAQQRPHATI